jgi:hypothetical protein
MDGDPWEVEGQNYGMGKGRQIRWMYFVLIHEKRTMQTIEFVLRRGKDL